MSTRPADHEASRALDPDARSAETEQTVASDEDVSASSGESSDPRIDGDQPRLWVTPAVVIVALMWFLLIVPGKLFPLTMIHFMSIQGGPIIGSILLMIWWLSSRRLPLAVRVGGLVLAGATIVATLMAGHHTMFLTMMIYGIPLALTIFVGILFFRRSTPLSKRLLMGYVGFTTFLLGSLLFRIGEIDAAFSFTLVPRWTPTSEQQLVVQLKPDGSFRAEDAGSVSFPASTGEGDWAEFRMRDASVRHESMVLGSFPEIGTVDSANAVLA